MFSASKITKTFDDFFASLSRRRKKYTNMNEVVIPEVEQTVGQLERGTVVTKFFSKRKPEKKTLMIRRETRQIVWTRTGTTSPYEGRVDMREIKEIRLGKNSKDFEKWPDESKKLDNVRCFVVYYGNEFRLKTLSIAALSEKECELWVKGLRYLVQDTINATYPLQVERWLRKEFYSMENSNEVISLKDMKAFLPRVNYKIPTNRLRELFQEVDIRHRGEIGFDDFVKLYHKLIFDNCILEVDYSKLLQYTIKNSDVRIIPLQRFQKFLKEQQNDPLSLSEDYVSDFMRKYLDDVHRDVQEPYFTFEEFIDFLFSNRNDIWDNTNDDIYQDMNKPLSYYWVASSHNTYLMGDQISSESSCQAYVRALRAGCRCIELDCWDGPDGMPFIFHGHTLTTKIKFIDVIRTIKEHAFATSEYPVILSIEDNCTLVQQRKMAKLMQETFGDMLQSMPVDKNEAALPSPAALKRKILLKHKKLPDGGDESSFVVRNDESRKELDLRSTIKNGILYLEDPVDRTWNPHFFVLTQQKLFYTDTFHRGQEVEDEDDSSSNKQEGRPTEELHFGEMWFHGRLPNGRLEAEEILRRYSYLGDGTFLVRECVTFVGDYCLSFWRKDKVNHCRIKCKQEGNVTSYYLIEPHCFDSLYSLITHYRSYPLKSQEFKIKLAEPAPQPAKHEDQVWWDPSCSRSEAEDLLKRIPEDGAFMVRKSEKENNSYVLSFRAESQIKHCRIKLEGRLYTIGAEQYESLVTLINDHIANPLYNKVKLTRAVNRSMMKQRDLQIPDDGSVYAIPGYMDPATLDKKITCKAMFDYIAQKDDELTFVKHAIIHNVNKCEGGWWRGDYGGKKQHWFPSNYVEEINEDDTSDSLLLGNWQKGSLDIVGASCEVIQSDHLHSTDFSHILRIHNPAACSVFEAGAKGKEYAYSWMDNIQQTGQNASFRESKHKEIERAWKIAKEMSNLIVYFRSVTLNLEKLRSKGFVYYEMSSFPESKAEKLFQQERRFFLKYHQVQFSRVYPKGQRIDSSNYNPLPMWNSGCQMVALNYQTGDKAMQLNHAKFRDNGGCGYLLKPSFMFHQDYDPYDKNSLVGVETWKITIGLIGARHLHRANRGTASPFVQVEVLGADYDSGVKLQARTVADNGFNPMWTESCEFYVYNPYLAMIRFVVQDEDMFGDSDFIGQATYPVRCMRTGYRSVSLRNNYSEYLELASLLVHVQITEIPSTQL
ncbi:1-phosphatidylinositol 4,5-bisphosphate phosphodiesterase gamma-1 isoform X2 [Trichogramma pretiosum]|uniref:1-phosphatidylinositol 4,5-bisphosphate phosphodiesterase gamma-1 isoform X2 n=1 Tax=Trichogramma pretiosum TaxID=7493 RepID=UPI000C718C1B|nr:1-phosphatidylinositol 4,5-bisphosphate phosphodiesterase gamma-1 isoform X2 [Trichogramma pretiosum]